MKSIKILKEAKGKKNSFSSQYESTVYHIKEYKEGSFYLETSFGDECKVTASHAFGDRDHVKKFIKWLADRTGIGEVEFVTENTPIIGENVAVDTLTINLKGNRITINIDPS